MNGDLPAGYDAWKTAVPEEPEHVKACPRHEDNHDGTPARCLCPAPEDYAAMRAEAREDR